MKFLKTEVDRTTKNFSRLLQNSEMRILLIPKFNEEILLGNGTKCLKQITPLVQQMAITQFSKFPRHLKDLTPILSCLDHLWQIWFMFSVDLGIFQTKTFPKIAHDTGNSRPHNRQKSPSISYTYKRSVNRKITKSWETFRGNVKSEHSHQKHVVPRIDQSSL